MSNTVPLYGFGGGGGTALNFSVVGNPQPANPKENTIWIDADAEITSWIFSATQPETATEGMVWIATGATSTAEFNALKKNGIMIYPLNAKQYIGGAWAEREAKSYQNGAWVEWILWLFNYGKQDFQWKARGWKYSSSSGSFVAVVPSVVTNADGSISFTINASSGYPSGGMDLTEDFDLTDIKTLVFEYEVTGTITPQTNLVVIPRSAELWNPNTVAVATKSAKGNQTLTLDVTNIKGSYDIAIICYHNTANGGTGTFTVRMKTLKAERL